MRPFLFADGFAYGPSDLDGLFDLLDAPYSAGGDRFLEQLLSSAVDMILIGFDKRHDYVQVNAGVVQECIQRVLRERVGAEPLIVGGVSMGAMVARYAQRSSRTNRSITRRRFTCPTTARTTAPGFR